MLNSFQSIIFLFAYLQAYLIILIYVPQGQNHPEISMLYYPINDSRGIFNDDKTKRQHALQAALLDHENPSSNKGGFS